MTVLIWTDVKITFDIVTRKKKESKEKKKVRRKRREKKMTERNIVSYSRQSK